MRAFTLLVALLAASTAIESAEAQPLDLEYRIWTQVYPALDTTSYGYLEEFFDYSGVLLIAADQVERHIILRQGSMFAISGECGETNSRYLSAQNVIIICYELVDAILRSLPPGTHAQRSTTAAWAVAFLVFHELGHKLVDEFDLPVSRSNGTTGIREEEDAADQFATISLSEMEAAAPLAMGVAFARRWLSVNHGRAAGESTRHRQEEPSTHSSHEQRFWNILCWTYGSDTIAFSQLRESLPATRATGCAEEYRAISARWTGLLARHQRRIPARRIGSVPTLGSFAGPIQLPTAAGATIVRRRPPLETELLRGEWRFEERLGRKGRRPTCSNTARISMRRHEEWMHSFTITGVQGCDALIAASDEGDDRGFSGPIYSINGTMFFYASPCLYSGTPSRDGTRFRGTLRCVVMGLSGQPERFTGTWEAVRQ